MNIVAIPTIEALTTLKPLAETLLRDPAVHKLLLMDNGHGPEGRAWMRRMETADGRVVRVDTEGQSIYRMWNYAWDWALALDPDAYLAVLNDDIVICDGTIGKLAHMLDMNPELALISPDRGRRVSQGIDGYLKVRLCRGVYRHDGISGWCWMARAALRGQGLPRIDENFEWWGGDDDLAFAVEEFGGKLAVIHGIPLDHDHETTAVNHPWTYEARLRDRERMQAKWGDGW